MLILAGDIGGTKTLLQLSKLNKASSQLLFERRYLSQHFEHLSAMITVFLSEYQANAKPQSFADFKISAACLAIAGPIQNNTAQVTNLHWVIDAKALEIKFTIEKVRLINDFKAVAHAIADIDDKDLCVLQKGQSVKNAPKVVIGAGTGLGSAFLFYTGQQYQVFSSESSHVAFAPINDLEIQLLRFLQKKYQQVSYEHIVSGVGLVNILDALIDLKPTSLSADFKQALEQNDKAAMISQFALNKGDPIAEQTLAIFTQIYARQAANLALSSLAYGGVYIAGGIAPKIINRLKQTDFLIAFKNNTNMGHLLKNIPVAVVMNEKAGLLGAQIIASQLAFE